MEVFRDASFFLLSIQFQMVNRSLRAFAHHLKCEKRGEKEEVLVSVKNNIGDDGK